MTEFIINHKVQCGETTCASKPGKFCDHFGPGPFGVMARCHMFNVNLYPNATGLHQRCDACMKAEKEAK